jgi:16S rRNA (guanine1207-N2)-methyltransferase
VSDGHYFDDDPDIASAPTPVEISLPDVAMTLTTDRGVFASDRLDTGTKFLLLAAPPVEGRPNVLDLGCGWGPIACVVARRAPAATVWAIDVNSRARGLTEKNARSIGAAERVHVSAPADVPPALTFDRILSNPPIRIGKTALHDLLLTWLVRLSPAGVAHLVVHKHLGSDSLAPWLDGEGFATTRVASRAGYRILEVRPRKVPNR